MIILYYILTLKYEPIFNFSQFHTSDKYHDSKTPSTKLNLFEKEVSSQVGLEFFPTVVYSSLNCHPQVTICHKKLGFLFLYVWRILFLLHLFSPTDTLRTTNYAMCTCKHWTKSLSYRIYVPTTSSAYNRTY